MQKINKKCIFLFDKQSPKLEQKTLVAPMSSKKENNILTGQELIRSLASRIPSQSGSYKMLDSKNKIIYIGKAKDLKKRVYSYSSPNLSPRISYMVSQIYDIQWIVTHTEQDALLLEADLIKHFKPFYNILLKDDKNFPFIKIEMDQSFPRISQYRAKNDTPKDNLFGPFAKGMDVIDNIKLVQKTFKLRTCTDSYFKSRTQPCILYQIARCSGPCTNKITQIDYIKSANQAKEFLQGNNDDLKVKLANEMMIASKNHNFEQAIILRERIKSINALHFKQNMVLEDGSNADFIAIIHKGFKSNAATEAVSIASNSLDTTMPDCTSTESIINTEILHEIYLIQIFLFRNGHSHGSLEIFPKINLETNAQEVIESFLVQFYQDRQIPDKIYINLPIEAENKKPFKLIENFLNKKLLAEQTKISSLNKVQILNPDTKKNKEMMGLVLNNAFIALERQQANQHKWLHHFKELQNLLKMEVSINNIEVYDNSHLYGTFSLGALISANVAGFNKKNYRTFNLKDISIKSNDDYGILEHTLLRRLSKLKTMANNQADDSQLSLITSKGTEVTLPPPELLIIDGGKGQLSTALKVVNQLNINNLRVLAVAKGKNRHAGEETLFLDTGEEIHLDKHSSVLHFIQLLRNEAHRFAITAVRKKKINSLSVSEVDKIPGVGKQRKRDLLSYFGSFEKIVGAKIEDLQKVKNINKTMAIKIFNWLH
ncbi:Excinuclease ABC subunit UvrC [Candidatus Hepatincolaceae symbiont of Richtersius coronifer]